MIRREPGFQKKARKAIYGNQGKELNKTEAGHRAEFEKGQVW